MLPIIARKHYFFVLALLYGVVMPPRFHKTKSVTQHPVKAIFSAKLEKPSNIQVKSTSSQRQTSN